MNSSNFLLYLNNYIHFILKIKTSIITKKSMKKEKSRFKRLCFFILFLASVFILYIFLFRKKNIFFLNENFDPYITLWNKQLFPIKKLKVISKKHGTQLVVFPNNISLQIYTNYHFNDPKKLYNKNAEFHIMFDGEPTDITNPEDYDIIVSTKRNIQNSIFLPYYISYCVEANLDIRQINYRHDNYSLRKFAVFAYSNCHEIFPGVRRRRNFYENLVSKFGSRLVNLGKCYNSYLQNDGTFYTNDKKFRNFKFVIAFENRETEGYVSEKLINPIFAGCIPVYCGAPDVSRYINPKRIINVNDFLSDEDVFNRMIEIDNDQFLFEEIVSQPALVEVPSIYNEYSFLIGKGKIFRDIYDRSLKPLQDMFSLKKCVLNRIVLCTFADGTIYKSNRIENEANYSEYFDDIIAYSPDDLKNKWINDKVGLIEFDVDFTKKNKRGYGYWTWKPYIILRALCDKCQDGDILIYSDSGCSINPFMTTKMMEYISSVSGDTPILAFPMLHREKLWTKGDVIDRVFRSTSLEKREDLLCSNLYQFTGSTIIMRRCNDVLDFIKEWHTIAQDEGHRYIDDSPSLNNKDEKLSENRHDQSIFSLLCKRENHLVTLSLDNLIDSKDNNTQQVVFSRKRRKN
jgi:hypothetical protein